MSHTESHRTRGETFARIWRDFCHKKLCNKSRGKLSVSPIMRGEIVTAFAVKLIMPKSGEAFCLAKIGHHCVRRHSIYSVQGPHAPGVSARESFSCKPRATDSPLAKLSEGQPQRGTAAWTRLHANDESAAWWSARAYQCILSLTPLSDVIVMPAGTARPLQRRLQGPLQGWVWQPKGGAAGQAGPYAIKRA